MNWVGDLAWVSHPFLFFLLFPLYSDFFLVVAVQAKRKMEVGRERSYFPPFFSPPPPELPLSPPSLLP